MAIVRTWPGGAANVTPAAASIPTAGELNWAALTDFLVALAEGAQATSFQKFATRKALTTPVTISSATDCVIATDLSTPGAVAVNLPAGNTKQIFFIVDSKGDAATNNVTITPTGSDTVGGLTSLVLNHNRQGVMLAYNSSDTDWKIVANVVQPGTITSADISGVILPSKGGSGVSNNDASTLTLSGANAVVITTTGPTTITLPTTGTLATLAGTEALSNKTLGSTNTLTNATAASFTNSGTVSLPTGPETLVGRATADTLTNKTLGSTNTITGATAASLTNSGTITIPTGPETLVGRATTDTLTNKTLLSSNVTTDLKLSNQATLKLYEQAGSGTNFMGLSAPDSVTTDTTLKLPDGAGINGQVLTTNGTAQLSWTSPLVNPMDSAGDLIVGGALGAATKLDHPGAAGYVVASTGTSTTSFTQVPTLVGATASLTTQADGSADLNSLQGFNTTAATGPNLTFARSKNATLGSQSIVASGDRLGAVTFKGSNGTAFDSAVQLIAEVDGTPGATNDMPGRLRCLVSADGSSTPSEAWRTTNARNLLVGTTSVVANGAKLQVVDGITFPATQVSATDPNTLDDYEEGTWTPAIAGTTGAPTGVSYTVREGFYTKIGRQVHLQASVVGTISTKGTGQMVINGFPFTGITVLGGEYPCASSVGYVPLTSYWTFQPTSNPTEVHMGYLPSAGVGLAAVDWSNGSVSSTTFGSSFSLIFYTT